MSCYSGQTCLNRKNSQFRILKTLRLVNCLVFCNALAACDIQSVSVGEWAISTEGYPDPSSTAQATWTITDSPSLSIVGTPLLDVEEIELVGSRLMWSSSLADPTSPNGEPSRVNFNGTVNGNSLAGTLFTQFGNFTVRGVRQ